MRSRVEKQKTSVILLGMCLRAGQNRTQAT